MMHPVRIPVILGTTRKGRSSLHVARFVCDLLNQRDGVASELIDIASVPLPVDDAGEAIKDLSFATAMREADGIVIVSPEYNHSFPGLLKHVLDSCLTEYIHKAVGVVGVSAGPFAGTRMVQNLLPVLRELGLVTIFWDVNVGRVADVFAPDGQLRDHAFVGRADRFIKELLWMAKVLRHGREQVSLDDEAAVVPCPNCGTAMTPHATKPVPAEGDGEAVVAIARMCPGCGLQSAEIVSEGPSDGLA